MILRELFYFDKETLDPVDDKRYDADLDQSPVDLDDTRKTKPTFSRYPQLSGACIEIAF